MNKKLLFSVLAILVVFMILILSVVIFNVIWTSNKQAMNSNINSIKPNINTTRPNIVLNVYDDFVKEYTLSNEDSVFLYDLVTNMPYRNYNCDGLDRYGFSIDNSYYGIEIHENEIHIVPSDNPPNEGIITGKDYQTLKQILDKYPLSKISI